MAAQKALRAVCFVMVFAYITPAAMSGKLQIDTNILEVEAIQYECQRQWCAEYAGDCEMRCAFGQRITNMTVGCDSAASHESHGDLHGLGNEIYASTTSMQA